MFFSLNIGIISLKCEENCLKNKRWDRFLVIYKSSEKIDPEQFLAYLFVLETFYKNYNVSKVNDIFKFYKN